MVEHLRPSGLVSETSPPACLPPGDYFSALMLQREG